MSAVKLPKFISPDDWLAYIPDHQRKWVINLLHMLMKTDTKLYLKISYNTLFIYRLGPVCYFNLDKAGIYLAFYWGKDITENVELFEPDERKMIKIVRLTENAIKDHEDDLMAIFLNALELDESRYKKK